ncbi:MAG TPA: PEP/pyruvate-binding domain-containing protein, partial [Anaerolineales bacterium]|nr:PEP/pyruvate-binding domain-containing protein [Anaerolineales bacterium]
MRIASRRLALTQGLCDNVSMSVFSFESPDVTLETAGGKGLNLARLTRAGFAVPRGFIISIEAYRTFVEANRWLSFIGSAGETLSAEDVSALEKRSAQIRAAFSVGAMPEEVESAIRAAYQAFAGIPVAVRSSATAEDLPDLSFAGQQDTYLNVAGEEELLKAVVSCWSSLWTARAIGYRLRNRIPQEDVALAVIVQEMVPSDVSGVMFTANPLTGLRSETVIDATFGLGEALVSGQVEPDHYVVDMPGNRIVSKRLGSKEISTRSKSGGGVETKSEDLSAQQALTDEQILQLAELGQSIEKEYGFPQDVEWAFAAGNLHVLQARPITSLYPIPEESHDPLKVWFSFGAVQGMLQPLTPLGQDSVRLVLAGAAALFGFRLNHETIDFARVAGERLWIRVDGLVRNPIGWRICQKLLPMVEPGAAAVLVQLAN